MSDRRGRYPKNAFFGAIFSPQLRKFCKFLKSSVIVLVDNLFYHLSLETNHPAAPARSPSPQPQPAARSPQPGLRPPAHTLPYLLVICPREQINPRYSKKWVQPAHSLPYLLVIRSHEQITSRYEGAMRFSRAYRRPHYLAEQSGP